MHEHKDALEMLKATSRTFFIPINHLSDKLKDAVASAYLCMRAIDEIEDHPHLSPELKSELLRKISTLLTVSDETSFDFKELTVTLAPYRSQLPEVTTRLGEWISLCPTSIVSKVLDATSIMAKGMADWVEKDWQIKSEKDLDDYTYYVAGLVGVMLSDLWKWYDNLDTDTELAIAFGRGLQSVNILRNRLEDSERGVDFFPEGWTLEDMFMYARKNLALADKYIEEIPQGEIYDFCKIPLALAHGTLDTLAGGNEKLSRDAVNKIVSEVVGEKK